MTINGTRKDTLIVIEGTDGSGKTTQVQMLADRIKSSPAYKALPWIAKYPSNGHSVLVEPLLVTRQPGGADFGQTLRSILLSNQSDLSPLEELFLFQADRANHIRTVVKPHLEAGGIVLCDRWTHSTLAYQGYGHGLPLGLVEGLNKEACQGIEPDIAFILDCDPGTAQERLKGKSSDRIEQMGVDFFERVRKGYIDFFSPQKCSYLAYLLSATYFSLGTTAFSSNVVPYTKEQVFEKICGPLNEWRFFENFCIV